MSSDIRKGNAEKAIGDVDTKKSADVIAAEDGDAARNVKNTKDYENLVQSGNDGYLTEDLTERCEEETRPEPQQEGNSTASLDEETEDPVLNLTLLEQSIVCGPPIFFLQKAFETPMTGVLEVRVRDLKVCHTHPEVGETTDMANHITEVYYRISMLENDQESHKYNYLVEVFVRSPDLMVTLLTRKASQSGQDFSEDDRHAAQEYKESILSKAMGMKDMDTRLSFYQSFCLKGCTKTIFYRLAMTHPCTSMADLSTICETDQMIFSTESWFTSPDEFFPRITEESDIQELMFGVLMDIVNTQSNFITAHFEGMALEEMSKQAAASSCSIHSIPQNEAIEHTNPSEHQGLKTDEDSTIKQPIQSADNSTANKASSVEKPKKFSKTRRFFRPRRKMGKKPYLNTTKQDTPVHNLTEVKIVTSGLAEKEPETKHWEKIPAKKSGFQRFLSSLFGCCVCARRSH